MIISSGAALPPHPSMLRVMVTYNNSSGSPKNGVPPESIWVDITAATGNLKVNDETKSGTAWRIYAADSTRSSGLTRIFVPSCSGCGTLNVTLYVAGVAQGTRTPTIRTVDSNADGICDDSDFNGACDLNYDGVVNLTDKHTVTANANHWRRNALHGTPVRRTNFCETCREESTGTLGESEVFWSPDGQRISYTAHVGAVDANGIAPCKAFLLRSDPKQGNPVVQFTFPDSNLHDYDPSWSGRGTDIAYGRDDFRILRKGVAGANSDTLDYLVTASGDHLTHGDLTPAISPDGEWVAFGRRDPATGRYNMWKIDLYGDQSTLLQLTNTTNVVDFYPQWSPDGNWITFDRQIGPSTATHHAYKVKSNGDSLQAVYDAPSGKDAATPGFAPDGNIITAGIGTHDAVTRDVRAYTIDPVARLPILTYVDSVYALHGPDPVLSPSMSPDGTRLALRAKQVFAVRRNMNRPPVFTAVAGATIADTIVMVSKSATVNTLLSFTVLATDPESDAISYGAYFLQPGMSFNPSTRTFTWTPPPSSSGHTYYVKFLAATGTGGTDHVIVKIGVTGPLAPQGALAARTGGVALLGPNPSRGSFALSTPFLPGEMAYLRVYDLAGRLQGSVACHAGERATWAGGGPDGRPAPPGIYLYRLSIHHATTTGRFVLVR